MSLSRDAPNTPHDTSWPLDALHALETPCLVVHRARLTSNVERFERRAKDLGVALRPHLKTSKSVDVAKAIPSAAGHGITVSTLKEAEYFADAGFRDVLYAVCMAPQKAERAAALVARGVGLKVAVDDPAHIEGLIVAARRRSVRFRVLVELDCGEHRSGVDAEGEALLSLTRRIEAAPELELAGVFTHGGHSYGATTDAAREAIATAERRSVVVAAERIASLGASCAIRSVGSTPSFAAARDLAGVTEARPGVYVFGDLFQAGVGSCTQDDIALAVLTTVIGVQPATRRLVVDAGGLALSKDRSTRDLGAGDCGYGLVCTPSFHRIENAFVRDAYQEHGVVELGEAGDRMGDFPIGSRLLILPNHACMTAAAYDGYHAAGDGELAFWPRINAWA